MDVGRWTLEVAHFAEPGVLCWLRGRTSAGDPAFVEYRDGLRQLTSCSAATIDATSNRLRASGENATNFVALHILELVYRLKSSALLNDTTGVGAAAATLAALSDDHSEYALGHLGGASLATAERLQPALQGIALQVMCME